MKKRIQGRTLSRNATQRKALKRTMLVSLLNFGSIKTTLAKAKELRPFAERMITKAKRIDKNDKNSLVVVHRELKKDLPAKAVKQLIVLAESFEGRDGGYLRIIKLPSRKSDTAKLAIVEWVNGGVSENIDNNAKKQNNSSKKVKKNADKREEKTDKTSDKAEEASK